MKEIRKKLTYANVMSSLAVFLVLGGATAVAATHLGRNSVGTRQLKSTAVTPSKIRDAAITSSKIQDNSVSGADISNRSITGGDIAPGSISGDEINAASLNVVPTADRLAGEFQFTLPLNSAQAVPVDIPPPFYAFGSCSDLNLANGAALVVGSDAVDSFYGVDATFQPFTQLKTAVVEIEDQDSDPGEHPTLTKSQDGKLVLMSASGKMVAVENVSVTINVGPDRDCVFSGNVTILN